MGTLLYIILLVYFFIGAILIFLTNKHKNEAERRQSWIKYFVYLLIINILYFSILFNNQYYTYICVFISIMGLGEIIVNVRKSRKIYVGLVAILIFIGLSYFFILFSFSKYNYLLYAMFIITVFDAFSQLIGQLFGRRLLFPTISPNKTYEGLFGGLLATVITSVLIRELLSMSLVNSIVVGLGVSVFAFVGDFLASYLKRKFGIKDFSNLLPGHGGFLDRFDSLILGNIFMLFIIDFI